MNLASIVDDHARKRPDLEAVICGPTRLTYGRLDALANQIANGLVAHGVEPGDKVAMSYPNVPYFPIVYHAILKTGAVVVPLNVLLKPREIAYHLKDADAKAYLCHEGTPELPIAEMGFKAFEEVASCRHFFATPAGGAERAPGGRMSTTDMLMRSRPSTFTAAERSPEDTAVILYTSGTTGQPKGAELTHSNMLLNAIVSRDLHGFGTHGKRSVILIALPLFHSFGQTCQMNAGLYAGAALALVPRFDPKAVLDLMRRERVNFFSGVPTMFWALLAHARESGVDTAAIAEHLELCSSGGAALPVEVLHEFERTFGVQILEGYGLSETSPVATFNHRDLPRKVGSIGVPVMGVDVRVVDDRDEDVAVDEPGEILIRGHNVMKGYYKRPEATAEAMRGGWFHTGDIARRDADGYLFIVDRKKDMIVRAGLNVYPREIEEVMTTHPAVSMTAVVGVPQEALGEEIKAYVVRAPNAEIDEAELIEWCKENMAAYKYPRMIEFREQLPMSATGKILKRELRAEARAS